MRTTRLIAILVGVAAITMVAADASAYYHPGMGTFMSRDPGAGNANRIGAGGPAVGGGFIPRDPTGSNQYADGMNLYQYVRSSPVMFTDPTGLKCACCCVRNVNIGKGALLNTATHWGTKFDVTIKVEYKKGGKKQGLTDCELEWFERTDLPYAAALGQKPNQWHDMFAMIPNSPTLAPWVNRKKSPIPGTETVTITDTPALGKRHGRNAERTLYFAIRVKGGQSAECAKVCGNEATDIATGATINGSITAYATQYLKMVNGTGVTQTFSLGIPGDGSIGYP